MVEFEEIEDDDYSDTSAVAVTDGEDVWSDESSEDDDDDQPGAQNCAGASEPADLKLGFQGTDPVKAGPLKLWVPTRPIECRVSRSKAPDCLIRICTPI